MNRGERAFFWRRKRERVRDDPTENDRRGSPEILTALLRGKVLRRTTSDFHRDDALGSSSFERNEALFLYSDGACRYDLHTVSRVSTSGFSSPSIRTAHLEGEWSVDTTDGPPALVLRQSGAVARVWSLSSQADAMYLEGEPWSCEPIERTCW